MNAWIEFGKAVREAHLLGATFTICGDRVEVEGSIPDTLREALHPEMLWQHVGAHRADKEATTFINKLHVSPILVTDIVGADAAIADLDSCDIIGIDIETAVPGVKPAPVRMNKTGVRAERQSKPSEDGLDPHRSKIMTLQLYGGTNRCFVFRGEALSYVINSAWLYEQHLVAHNAAFEIAFLQKHGTPPAGVKSKYHVECTMQAAGLLFGCWDRSLAGTSKTVLELDPPKALQTSAWGAHLLSPGQIAYAAADAVLARDLWLRLDPMLAEKGRKAAYAIQRNVIPAVADMQLRGIGFNPEIHAQQEAVWRRELAAARIAYNELTGNPPPTTPAEIEKWLLEVVPDRISTWPRTKTGKLSTEQKHLKRLALADTPTARPVLVMKAMQNLLDTFGMNLVKFINPVTGRIHANYNIAATKAGRFSASNPNLQQLPSGRAPEFRKAVVAAPGTVFVGGDWNQIELRAAAWISGDVNLTAVFKDGRDLHTETASAISGVPVDQVTPEQRAAAKSVNFGSIYGIGARSLAEDAFDKYGVTMTELEAKAALDRFFARYSALHTWMRQHAYMCEVRGFVKIGRGRVVEAGWEYGKRLSFPQCCNLPVQGAAADAILQAMAMLSRRLRGINGGLVASVHDELIVEVAEADADKAKDILHETMLEAFEITFPGAPTTNVVDVRIGKNWKELKG